MIRACKDGGRIIISVPSEDSFLKYAINSVLNLPPHHVTRWPDKTFYYLSEKYSLDIELIHHERVQSIHKAWFLSTFFSVLLRNHKVVDLTLKTRLFMKIINYFSEKLSERIPDELLPYGHSVIVIFRKGGYIL